MPHHRVANVSDICAIQIGLTARGRLSRTPARGIPAIQMRDVPPGGPVRDDLVAGASRADANGGRP